ncbi:MAG: hypothetical protein R3B13_20915 [Polyangiaceae bacterium]
MGPQPNVPPADASPPLARGSGPLRLLWPKVEGNYPPVVVRDGVARLTEAERAATGYLISQINANCYWEGRPVTSDDSGAGEGDLECALTRALGLGYQCGDAHREFVEGWLGTDAPPDCIRVADSAFVEPTLRTLTVDSQGELVTLEYHATKTDGLYGKTWAWSERIEFERTGRASLRVRGRKVIKGRAPRSSLAPRSSQPEVSATVVGVTTAGGRHSVPDTRVELRFENTSDAACDLSGYELRWSLGGHARRSVSRRLAAHGSLRLFTTLPGPASVGLSTHSATVLAHFRCSP